MIPCEARFTARLRVSASNAPLAAPTKKTGDANLGSSQALKYSGLRLNRFADAALVQLKKGEVKRTL